MAGLWTNIMNRQGDKFKELVPFKEDSSIVKKTFVEVVTQSLKLEFEAIHCILFLM